ncbi:hypothetical protein [Aliihoeflea sp. PC F10.4]
MSTITEQSAVTATPSKASAKAELTDQVSRAIIDEEAARRIAKTEKLRLARLEHEAKQAAEAEPPAKKPRQTKTAPKRAKSSA